MSKQPKIQDLKGWILICRDDDAPQWHIAWLEPFETKKSALEFATRNHWPKPWRAVRGRVTTDHQ